MDLTDRRRGAGLDLRLRRGAGLLRLLRLTDLRFFGIVLTFFLSLVVLLLRFALRRLDGLITSISLIACLPFYTASG